MDRCFVSRFVPVSLLLAAVLFALPAAAVPASPSWAPPYEVQVVVDGTPVREFLHDGRYYVEGRKGERYVLRLVNRTDRRVEVVATVDGLDVVDGKPGDFVRKRGYVLAPWQTYDIDGFRLDMGRVAAFRFSSVNGSYAARTGNARNVGVIGVAFFEERRPMPRPRPMPMRPRHDEEGEFGGGARRYSEDDGDARFESRAAGPTASAQARGGAGFGSFDAPADTTAAEAPASAVDALASRERSVGKKSSRPGLGTAFGESRYSSVVETTFVRASGSRPTRLVSVRYDDRDGLIAQGVPVNPPPPSDTWLRATADPFPAAPHRRRFSQPPSGWDQ